MTRPLDLPDDVLILEWATSPAGASACGLIVTDGCLRRPQGGGARGNVSPRLRVVLKPEDRSGIESLADAFGIAHHRVRRTATGVSLQFGHPKLRFLVDGLGMPLGDKTSVARLPEVLVLNDHAWRGVIDGDGYVSAPLSRGYLRQRRDSARGPRARQARNRRVLMSKANETRFGARR